jgi:MoxR-like ATPase
LILGAKALSLMSGRSAPETSDVREVAPYVLPHRIVPNYRATGEGLKPLQLVEALINEVPEPAY